MLAELSSYLTRRLTGERGDEGGRFDWLNAFDANEVREFVGELRAAMREVATTDVGPELIEGVLHEWQESAIRPKEYLAALKRSAKQRR